MAKVQRTFEDAGRVGHLLWETSARSQLLSEAALADTPLTPTTAGVLDVIAANPGTSIAAIARVLPTSQQGISRTVARLQELGFLERGLGARGYGVALHVTEAGEAARREANARQTALERRLREALGPDEHARLAEALDRLRIALEDLSG